MPATHFICPNGSKIPIDECLKQCPFKIRCIARPAITALAKGVRNRKLKQYSVTELLKSTRESYLLKTFNYAVDPMSLVASSTGTALHNYNEAAINSDAPWLITEERFNNEIASGQIDSYGYIFNNEEAVLCDYKLTSTAKIAKALGYGYKTVETNEVYKTGIHKGEKKTKKIFCKDFIKKRMEWALQQNFYRILLEEAGYKVDGMYIQAYAKDFIKGRNFMGVKQPMYIIKINKISDYWLKIYFKAKKDRLDAALKYQEVPKMCKPTETWNGIKCENYCNVREICKKFQTLEYLQQQNRKAV